jgi:hypothetical protein
MRMPRNLTHLTVRRKANFKSGGGHRRRNALKSRGDGFHCAHGSGRSVARLARWLGVSKRAFSYYLLLLLVRVKPRGYWLKYVFDFANIDCDLLQKRQTVSDFSGPLLFCVV